MLDQIREAVKFIQEKITAPPEIALILGSGLGDLAYDIEDAIVIPYEEIPHFPISTVEGHEGKLFIGKLSGKTVVAMQGRFHFYEGYSMQEVTLPVRVMKALGAEVLIATNAAGGLRPDLDPGSLMILTDHIFMGVNPLIGKNENELGERFPDMSEAYSKQLIEIAEKAAQTVDVPVVKGVYYPISGPSYSTKAELRMMIKLGADAVGMSTAPEVIVANHSKMKVLGISCITDNSNPDIMHAPSHEAIVKVANETKPKFIRLIKEIVKLCS